MKYTKLLFPMMLLVASGVAFAANEEGSDISFDELDHDGDGIISRDEAEATPGLNEAFDTLDANADGVLDESEVGVGGPDAFDKPEDGPAQGPESEQDPEADIESDPETDY